MARTVARGGSSIKSRLMNARRWLGDWEGDTLIGKGHRGVFVTLVERKSKYTVLEGAQHKTAAAVRKAVARGLRPHQARVQTITDDNGREFSDQAGMAKDLDARIY
nr:IS30 family transposase [Nitrosospira sp.]